ncbi:hypothetical protein ACWKSP_34935 [Micromonosporaceae bacterium Da 78-11]
MLIAALAFGRDLFDVVIPGSDDTGTTSTSADGGTLPVVPAPAGTDKSTTTEPATTEPSIAQPPAGPVLRTGPAILNNLQVMDLDAPARDLQWSIRDDSADPGTPEDLKWSHSYGLEQPSWGHETYLLLLDDHADDAVACPTLTGYSKKAIAPDKLDRGSSVCVKTKEGNLALVNVTEIEKGNEAIHLDVTVIGG